MIDGLTLFYAETSFEADAILHYHSDGSDGSEDLLSDQKLPSITSKTVSNDVRMRSKSDESVSMQSSNDAKTATQRTSRSEKRPNSKSPASQDFLEGKVFHDFEFLLDDDVDGRNKTTRSSRNSRKPIETPKEKRKLISPCSRGMSKQRDVNHVRKRIRAAEKTKKAEVMGFDIESADARQLLLNDDLSIEDTIPLLIDISSAKKPEVVKNLRKRHQDTGQIEVTKNGLDGSLGKPIGGKENNTESSSSGSSPRTPKVSKAKRAAIHQTQYFRNKKKTSPLENKTNSILEIGESDDDDNLFDMD
jgi:hypothetical protein